MTMRDWVLFFHCDYADKKGEHLFQLCMACQTPIWRMTATKKPHKIVVIKDGENNDYDHYHHHNDGLCQECREFGNSNYAIFSFIMKAFHNRDIVKGIKE